ncbi:transcriptional regulator [Marinicauda pacifica]|jgi:transcriptional regulator with XRE-family HTH domain|uniref:XRE family transcriptional regulator n=1 Tax=Marinicauda pacifica TaxID=1133559 RepID=A0A4V3RZ09_9PROT|nr:MULTISPECIES: helix-turn-helix domain-containing protein [Marinicauda]TGY92519.1 XRE family transcriptional regulator [Marinicauda pacifica]GGE49578.1 transcriptional regulator [Marinicauda pacifica]
MSTNPRGPNAVDRHVGSRVRLRRQLLNMSQEKLGEELGVTFQQVQKYERGANRIGAGRLWNLARVLDVPVSFFFEGASENAGQSGFAEGDQTPIIDDFIQSADGVQLAQAFARIRDSKVRRRILELVRTLAAEEAEAGADENEEV